MRQKRSKRGGRPPKELDISPERIAQLAAVNATVEDIATQAGCSRDTIERRYRDAIKRARAEFRTRILLAQIKAAERGNAALLIWLGKQYLGQVENPVPEPEQDPDVDFDLGVGGRLCHVRATGGTLTDLNADLEAIEGA